LSKIISADDTGARSRSPSVGNDGRFRSNVIIYKHTNANRWTVRITRIRNILTANEARSVSNGVVNWHGLFIRPKEFTAVAFEKSHLALLCFNSNINCWFLNNLHWSAASRLIVNNLKRFNIEPVPRDFSRNSYSLLLILRS